MLYIVDYRVRFGALMHGGRNVMVAGSSEAALHIGHRKHPRGIRAEHYHLMQYFQHGNARLE